MNITIKTVSHQTQRYETPADWQFDQNGDLLITVSDIGNWKQEALLALHELVEVCLCKDRNVTQEAVDAFDTHYEEERKQGLHARDDEPGDDAAAPYRREHFFATNIERLFAEQLGVDWEEYAKTIIALEKTE